MANEGMADYWNGRPADVWVAEAKRFDTLLAPCGRRMLEAVSLEAGEQVLDVGCGNGAVSRQAAWAVAPGGTVTGVDLSAPMLARARQWAAEEGVAATFIQGDAQTASFDRQFDVVVSRFGVMFFDDPLAAFANLARVTRPGGRMAFVCWQEMFANEWIAVPATTMVAHVGLPELPPPGAPGPFSLADAERTAELLTEAGWSEVSVQARRDELLMGRDPDDVVSFMFSDEMGRRLVEGKDHAAVKAGTKATLEALRPFCTPEGVVRGGAYWLVTAHRQ